MKVLRFAWIVIFFIAIGVCSTACSNGDEENEYVSDDPVTDIIGSWKYIREFGYYEGKEYSEQRLGNQVWIFSGDGTLTYTDRDGDTNRAKWSIKDKILTVGIFDYTIEVLTSKHMVLSEGEEGWNIEKREYDRIAE